MSIQVPETHAIKGKDDPSHCTDPTVWIEIYSEPVAFAYDKNELRVPRGVCVQLTFYNPSLTIEHDFTVDADGVEGIKRIHVSILDKNDGNGVDNFNFTTPDADVTFKFYCTVQGHEAAGMRGKLIVGEGSPEEDSPGFGFYLAITAFIGMVLLIPRLKK